MTQEDTSFKIKIGEFWFNHIHWAINRRHIKFVTPLLLVVSPQVEKWLIGYLVSEHIVGQNTTQLDVLMDLKVIVRPEVRGYHVVDDRPEELIEV